MREILFRGKMKTKNSKWIEGFLIKEKNTERIYIMPYLEECGECDGMCCEGFGWEYEVIPKTVGQYTGLTDKTGKKIFTGDILKIETIAKGKLLDAEYKIYDEIERIDYAIVQEDEKTGGYKLKVYHNGKYKRISRFDAPHILLSYKADIVGNIHDNPELLEEQL